MKHLRRTSGPVIGLILLLIAGCNRSHPTSDDAPALRATSHNVEFSRDNAQLESVQTARVAPIQQRSANFTGRITWNEDFTNRVFSPVFGRVEKITATIGQHVKPGDDLALMRSADFGQAQADFRKALSDLAQFERTFARVKALREHGAAAEKDLESAQADFNRAVAEKQRAEARLRLLGGLEGDFSDLYHLSSPIGGVVVDRNVNIGQEVRADIILAGTTQLTAPLFVVTDPTKLWVLLDVPESDLGKLRLSQTIEVRSPAYPTRVFSGTLESIGAFLDPQTRVARVRASIDNSERLLKAEMYVNVRVAETVEVSEAVEVPARSVIFLNGKHYVFLETGPRRFERREVGLEQEGGAGPGNVIVHGVPVGQRVISEGSLLINELLAPPATVPDPPAAPRVSTR
jgi:cobalt-zinc-cadmium efflux system membrane fusion protein